MAENLHVMSGLDVFLTCGLIYLLFLGAKVILALRYRKSDRTIHAEDLKPETVAVMQAILSGDPTLSETLESNLISLAGQHFLWMCDESDAEAIHVTGDLKVKYPGERIEVMLCPACPPETNPKVFKIMHASDRVRTPFFLVLDDDTHLPGTSAAVLVHHARSHDIATGLPHYQNSRRFFPALVAQFVNNNSGLTYLSMLPFMRPISINGMCYAMKSQDLDVFQSISHHLTDDLALANAIKDKGGSIYQSSSPQLISTSVDHAGHYLRLMHRWHLFALLLLKYQKSSYKLWIFLMHGWHPLMLWAMVITFALAPSFLLAKWAVVFLLTRGFLLGMLQFRLFGRWLHQPLISLASEWLQPFHWVHALVEPAIVWRSRRYRVRDSDDFQSDE